MSLKWNQKVILFIFCFLGNVSVCTISQMSCYFKWRSKSISLHFLKKLKKGIRPNPTESLFFKSSFFVKCVQNEKRKHETGIYVYQIFATVNIEVSSRIKKERSSTRRWTYTPANYFDPKRSDVTFKMVIFYPFSTKIHFLWKPIGQFWQTIKFSLTSSQALFTKHFRFLKFWHPKIPFVVMPKLRDGQYILPNRQKRLISF